MFMDCWRSFLRLCVSSSPLCTSFIIFFYAGRSLVLVSPQDQSQEVFLLRRREHPLLSAPRLAAIETACNFMCLRIHLGCLSADTNFESNIISIIPGPSSQEKPPTSSELNPVASTLTAVSKKPQRVSTKRL